jgi:peptidoglycan/LPS O-acetylase OafA/YrhL
MYAILPALFLLLRRHTSIWAVAVIWISGIAIAVLEYIARNGNGDLDFLITRYFPCFLAGIAAWRLSRTFLSKISGTAWAFYLVFLALAYRFVDILRVYGAHFWSALHGTLRVDHRIWWPSFVDLPRDWAFCALTALAIPLFTQVEQRQVNGFTKWIATYSYGIYICHIPILWLCFVRFHLWSASVGAVLSTLLTAFTASLLYHLVENPGIRAGKRLASRMSSRLSLAREPNHDVQGVPKVSGN